VLKNSVLNLFTKRFLEKKSRQIVSSEVKESRQFSLKYCGGLTKKTELKKAPLKPKNLSKTCCRKSAVVLYS